MFLSVWPFLETIWYIAHMTIKSTWSDNTVRFFGDTTK